MVELVQPVEPFEEDRGAVPTAVRDSPLLCSVALSWMFRVRLSFQLRAAGSCWHCAG